MSDSGYSLMPPPSPPPQPPGDELLFEVQKLFAGSPEPSTTLQVFKGGGDFRGQKGDRKTPPSPPRVLLTPPCPPIPPPGRPNGPGHAGPIHPNGR